MKSIKFIPVAILTALLASCGSSKPKFADKGNVVQSGTQFATSLSAAMLANQYFMENTSGIPSTMTSKVGDSKSSSSVKSTIKRNDKKFITVEASESSKTSFKYDSSNLRAASESSDTKKNSVDEPNGSDSRSVKSSTDYTLQSGYWNTKQYLIAYDNDLKTGSPVAEITAQMTPSLIFSYYIKSLGAQYLSQGFDGASQYINYVIYQQSGSPIIIDGTTLTVTLYENAGKVFTVEAAVNYSKANEYYMDSQTTTATYQIDLTSGAEAARYSIVTEGTRSVFKDGTMSDPVSGYSYSAFANDKIEFKEEQYYEFSVKDKDATVKEVKTADYKLPTVA